MKRLPHRPDASRLIAISLLALLVFTLMGKASANSCDCGCPRYASLIDSLPELSTQTQYFLNRCGGACANAWAHCEAVREQEGEWPSLAEDERDSEKQDQAESVNGNPALAQPDDPTAPIYLP